MWDCLRNPLINFCWKDHQPGPILEAWIFIKLPFNGKQHNINMFQYNRMLNVKEMFHCDLFLTENVYLKMWVGIFYVLQDFMTKYSRQFLDWQWKCFCFLLKRAIGHILNNKMYDDVILIVTASSVCIITQLFCLYLWIKFYDLSAVYSMGMNCRHCCAVICLSLKQQA